MGANSRLILQGVSIVTFEAINVIAFGSSDIIYSLCFAFILDYITGVAAAGYTKKKEGKGGIDSRIGLWGFIKKVMYLVAISGTYHIINGIPDFQSSSGMIRDGLMYILIGNEGVSIVENLNELEFPGIKVLEPFFSRLKTIGEDKLKKDAN